MNEYDDAPNVTGWTPTLPSLPEPTPEVPDVAPNVVPWVKVASPSYDPYSREALSTPAMPPAPSYYRSGDDLARRVMEPFGFFASLAGDDANPVVQELARPSNYFGLGAGSVARGVLGGIGGRLLGDYAMKQARDAGLSEEWQTGIGLGAGLLGGVAGAGSPELARGSVRALGAADRALNPANLRAAAPEAFQYGRGTLTNEGRLRPSAIRPEDFTPRMAMAGAAKKEPSIDQLMEALQRKIAKEGMTPENKALTTELLGRSLGATTPEQQAASAPWNRAPEPPSIQEALQTARIQDRVAAALKKGRAETPSRAELMEQARQEFAGTTKSTLRPLSLLRREALAVEQDLADPKLTSGQRAGLMAKLDDLRAEIAQAEGKAAPAPVPRGPSDIPPVPRFPLGGARGGAPMPGEPGFTPPRPDQPFTPPEGGRANIEVPKGYGPEEQAKRAAQVQAELQRAFEKSVQARDEALRAQQVTGRQAPVPKPAVETPSSGSGRANIEVPKGQPVRPQQWIPPKFGAEGYGNREAIEQLGMFPTEGAVQPQFAGMPPVPPKPLNPMGMLREAFNFTTSARSTYDWSGPGRQLYRSLLAHPTQIVPVLRAQARGMSAKSFAEMERAWKTAPNAIYRDLAGVEMAEIGTDMAKREEAIASALAERVLPKAKNFNQAYVSAINSHRDWLFNFMLAQVDPSMLTPMGLANGGLDELKRIGKAVNAATGRGSDLGGLLKDNSIAGIPAFWAPRLLVAQFQVPLSAVFSKSPVVRREMRRQMIAFVAVNTMLLKLGAETGVFKTETDPRSADFGQIVIGDRRYDLWAGNRPIANLIARLGYGLAGKDNIKFESGELAKKDNVDIVSRFLRTKLSPLAGEVVTQKAGRELSGEKIDTSPQGRVKHAVWNLGTSLFLSELVEDIKGMVQEGEAPGRAVARGVIANAPYFSGISGGNYQPVETGGRSRRPVRQQRQTRPQRPSR